VKAWSVSDKWYEVQIAVIAETRGKALAGRSGADGYAERDRT
jgi:hypothetical protein